MFKIFGTNGILNTQNSVQRIVLLWTLCPAERDALLANEAARKRANGIYVLAELACTRSSRELFQAREEYHIRFKRSLEEDVAHYITGDFRKVSCFSFISSFSLDKNFFVVKLNI